MLFLRLVYYNELLIDRFNIFETFGFSYRVEYHLITNVKTNHL